MGFAIYQAQLGLRHRDAKPLRGFGSGVLEAVSRHDGDTFRAVYTVRFETAVYVLHAFQKKAKRGIATPKPELDLVRRRLAAAERHYRDTPSRRLMPWNPTETTVERGSGNVFADLGFPDADAHLVKAELVSRIDDIVRQARHHPDRGRPASRPVPARRVPTPAGRLPASTRWNACSRLLTTLGRDVDIVIRQPRSPSGGQAPHRRDPKFG